MTSGSSAGGRWPRRLEAAQTRKMGELLDEAAVEYEEAKSAYVLARSVLRQAGERVVQATRAAWRRKR